MRLTEEELKKILVENPDLSENPLPRFARVVRNKNKYNAVKTYSEICQRTFDSKAEAARGEELALLEKGGLIEDLQYQYRFILNDKPRITITIDFVYVENCEHVYEDVKGILTRDSRTKLAWLKEKYDIAVRLIQ